jgi:modulator of FtsH protease HflK
VKIPITEQQIVMSTVGWYFTTPEQELSGEELPAGVSLNPAIDGYVITADRNIIHTRATLRYHIDDPIRYMFSFASASNTVQNALNNALLFAAARFNVDDILLNRVNEFREAVQQRVSDLTEAEQLGIVIEQCEIQSIPPRQLQNVFSQVTTSRENRNKLLIDAQSYTNRILSQASAQAVSLTNAAATATANYVKSINAEAARFTGLLPYYQGNPSLFVQQTFVQTMAQVLTNVQRQEFLPTHAGGKPIEVRLMLNDKQPEPKPAPSP